MLMLENGMGGMAPPQMQQPGGMPDMSGFGNGMPPQQMPPQMQQMPPQMGMNPGMMNGGM